MHDLIRKIKTQSTLGMSRTKVELKPHDDNWVKIAQDFSLGLNNLFNTISVKFYHIGSTSIPNINAKPILDILGVANDINEYDANEDLLKNLGFTCKGEYMIKGRRYSVLYNSDKRQSYIHLHVYEQNHPEIKKHLLFCKYLQENSKEALKYNELKLELHKKFSKNREKYTQNKSTFINKIIDLANISSSL